MLVVDLLIMAPKILLLMVAGVLLTNGCAWVPEHGKEAIGLILVKIFPTLSKSPVADCPKA